MSTVGRDEERPGAIKVGCGDRRAVDLTQYEDGLTLADGDRALDPPPDPKPPGAAAWVAEDIGVVAACELAVPPHPAMPQPQPRRWNHQRHRGPRPRLLSRSPSSCADLRRVEQGDGNGRVA